MMGTELCVHAMGSYYFNEFVDLEMLLTFPEEHLSHHNSSSYLYQPELDSYLVKAIFSFKLCF